MRPYSSAMCKLVDATIIITLTGVCCVYLVFVADNITKVATNKTRFHILPFCTSGIQPDRLALIDASILQILKTYSVNLPHYVIFISMLPVALLLVYIRTLRRLAIASTCANLLQVVGISIILQYLIRNLGDMKHVTLSNSFENMALGKSHLNELLNWERSVN